MGLVKLIGKCIAVCTTVTFLGVSLIVPVKDRHISEEQHIVYNVEHHSRNLDKDYNLHGLFFMYDKKDRNVLNLLMYDEDEHPMLNKLKDGDTIVKKIYLQATLADLVLSAIKNKEISILYTPDVEYDVIKKSQEEYDLPPDVI